MNNEYCKAIERHLYNFYRKAANHAGLTFRNFCEFSVVSGIPGTWPNYCFNLKAADNKLPGMVKFMVQEMKMHHIPPFIVVGNDVNQELANELFEKEGFKLVMQWSGMAAPINQTFTLPEIESFHIDTVTDKKQLESFIHLVETQLMRSRKPEMKVFEKFITDVEITMYMAYYHGEPVGTALLYINNGIAGVYMVSVHESVRSKGIGKAMTARMMNDAKEKACKLAILHATKDGERVYRKFGFEEYGKINIYWLVGKEFI